MYSFWEIIYRVSLFLDVVLGVEWSCYLQAGCLPADLCPWPRLQRVDAVKEATATVLKLG